MIDDPASDHRAALVGDGAAWLGMARVGDAAWRLPVRSGLISGAGALFGGCATAAALVAAADLAPQPLLWASAHFGGLAKQDTVVDLVARTVSAGRTMTHVEVRGTVDDRESFLVRVAAGARPDHHAAGQWATPPEVADVGASEPFDHPVHQGTWAARFEWRLAGTSGAGAIEPWAAWWVRPAADDPAPAVVTAAVLTDYVTYGVGRALGQPMGGLSIDNVLRLHRPNGGAPEEEGWLLLEVRPVGIAGGFGHGDARLFTGEMLLAAGSQSMVVNGWDWRLPAEREERPPV